MCVLPAQIPQFSIRVFIEPVTWQRFVAANPIYRIYKIARVTSVTMSYRKVTYRSDVFRYATMIDYYV